MEECWLEVGCRGMMVGKAAGGGEGEVSGVVRESMECWLVGEATGGKLRHC